MVEEVASMNHPHASLLESLWFVVPLFVVSALFVRSAKDWYRLSHVPGPRLAGFSKWWQLSTALEGISHQRIREACDKFGRAFTQSLTYHVSS